MKFLADNASVRVLVTGSSALRIEQGRDSLAGRISTLEAGVFSLTEIGPLHGLEPPRPFLPGNGFDELGDRTFWTALREHGRRHSEFRIAAFRHFSQRGGYPIVHRPEPVDRAELADLLYETVIRRVVQHDLLNGEGRRQDSALLETLLHLACRYAGLAPAVSELAEQAGLALGAAVDVPPAALTERRGHANRGMRRIKRSDLRRAAPLPALGRPAGSTPSASWMQAHPRGPTAARSANS